MLQVVVKLFKRSLWRHTKVETIVVYPIPAKADAAINLKFDFLETAKRTVSLKDLTGKVFWKTILHEAKGEVVIQPLGLRLGMYLLQLMI
jgi:hypothetical protein